jgi:hypothetical protein
MLRETTRARALAAAVALLLASGAASAGEVYRTTDAQGRPVFTDKPPSLPAERLDVKTATTDTVAVQQRYDAQMQRYAEQSAAEAKAREQAETRRTAAELTAEDRAKRCQEARARYERVQNSWRLYEAGPTEGERRYLSAAEIDAARENARRVMEEFCAQP